MADFETNSSTFITESLWQTIHEEVLNQCDGLDGAVDGYELTTFLLASTFPLIVVPPPASSKTQICVILNSSV